MKAIAAAVMAAIVAVVIIFSVVTGVKGLIGSAQKAQAQAIAAIDGAKRRRAMNGGRHVAKERGIVAGGCIYKRIEALIAEKPWLVVRALSTLPEKDRKSLKWVLARV